MEERTINLREILRVGLKHWKAIVIVAVIFAALGGGYSYYKNRGASVQTAETEKAAEKDSVKEEAFNAINEAIARYETTLAGDKYYLDHSLLMRIDPYQEVCTKAEIEIRAARSTDINELAMIGRQYISAISSDDFLEKISEKYDIEPKYLREIYSVTSSELVVEPDSTNFDESSTAVIEGESQSERSYYLTISVRGTNSDFTQGIYNDAVEYIQDNTYLKSLLVHTLICRSPFTYTRVNTNLISSQNAVRARIYDYSDKLVKIKKNLNDLLLNESLSGTKTAAVAKVNKKYVLAGFVGGAILAFLFFVLKYLLGNDLESEEAFFSRFKMRNLGTAASVEDEKNRYALITANIANIVHDQSEIMFTGTLGDEAVQSLRDHIGEKLKESCDNTKFVFRGDYLKDPETRKQIRTADGVILVEKLKQSRFNEIEEEIKSLTELDKKIVGVVLV